MLLGGIVIIDFHKKYFRFLVVLLVIVFTITGCSSYKTFANVENERIKISYIDVGQGDSELIQVNNKNLLIDAGPSQNTDKLISFLKSQKIRKLDYVIATHPHEDHIGGMPAIIKKYPIDKFYAPKIIANTQFFENMVTALKDKDMKIYPAKSGMSIDLGKNTKCNIIAPNNNKYENLNDYSIVLVISYKNCKFLFTGDAENLSEEEILNNNYDISCNVLKIGHHGSKTSSSDEFLDKTRANIAVISCGKDNDYGHPNKTTLEKLKRHNIKIYRTDLEGNIILTSNGNSIFKY